MRQPRLGRGLIVPRERSKLRLFICNRCQSIETLPDFLGKDPDDDVLLNDIVQRHMDRHGERRVKVSGKDADMALVSAYEDDWHNDVTRKEIIRRIRTQQGHSGLDAEFYATTDTYRSEATKCYERHNRPTNPGCIDYCSPSKLLGNALQDEEDLNELSRSERRDLNQSRPKVFLCNFCPFESLVLTQKRKKAGLYNL